MLKDSSFMISPLKEYRMVKGYGERIPEWSYLQLDGWGRYFGVIWGEFICLWAILSSIFIYVNYYNRLITIYSLRIV